MPELAAAGTRAGGLLPPVAAQTGLPAGLPVHLGAGDTHMSALAAGSQAAGAPIVVAEAAAQLQAWFPLLVSPRPAAAGWAREATAGPTGEIADRLTGLAELSGPGLRAALTARGFAVGQEAARSEKLTVLAGNPFFGPDGWHAWPAPTVFGLTPAHTGADVLDAARLGTCLALGQVLQEPSRES